MAKGYQSERTGADVDRLLDKIDKFNPATKVDKVSGKQLSTEDFTTALKQKLQGLENYDDTEINNAIAGLRRDFDTLISGDTSEAIDTFNDIVAFLEGIEESENLDNIIAAIQLQIAGKQDKISDLGTIRAGAALGATSVQGEYIGDLKYAYAGGLYDDEASYALPSSAYGDEDDILLTRDTVKKINGQSIYGNGNIYIAEYDDTFLSDRVSELEENKADKDGDYPDMSVGLAEDLGGRPFFEDAEFVFRASAGEDYSIKDGLATIKEIKGNSVVWNQKVKGELRVQDGTMSQSGDRYTITPTGEYAGIQTEITELIQGHKYICLCSKVGGSKSLNLNWGGYDSLANAIFAVTNINKTNCIIYAFKENETFTLTRPIICDLTKMFGQGNEPSTIEEYNARKPIVADEYAYNEGEVISMNTESIKSVGENLFNKEKATRGYIENNQFIEAESSNRYGLLMRCIPNTEYYLKNAMTGYFLASACFYDANMNYIDYDYVADNSEVEASSGIITTADNATYMVVLCNQDYLDSCMVSLVHSGWKQDVDAGYQPYWEDNLDLSVIGKYFPQGMKKAGSAHDEIRFNKASGKWEAVQRIGSVDMGSLEWVYNNVAGQYRFYSYGIQNSIMKPNSTNTIANIVCSRYIPDSWNTLFVNLKDKIVAAHTGGPIAVFDSAYTDAASFKAAMSGVMLYYELAEPIVTEIAEDIELIYDVADFGTEEAIASVPSTPFRARIMYDFNANDSIRNNSVTIRELKRMIAELTNRINSLESNQQ